MEILRVNLDFIDPFIINTAREVLKDGGILVYPTDTVYGLGGNALNEKVIKKVFEMKKRPTNKPLPVIVKSLEMAKKLAYIDKKKEKILKSVWPGAVTVVLHKKDRVPSTLTSENGSIGLRIPDFEFIHVLMEDLDLPLIATSANISGLNPSGDIGEVLSQLKQSEVLPDLVLDAGILPQKEPSTILDLCFQKPKISRIGPVSKENLLKLLET